jgi:hypothetical protein
MGRGAQGVQIFTVGQKATQNSGKTLKFRKNFDMSRRNFCIFAKIM